MAVFSKTPFARRRWFVGLSLLALGMVFTVGALLWQAAELSSLTTVSDQVTRLKSFAGAIRLLLIGALAVFWPRLVDLIHHYGRVGSARRSQLHALRWRVIAWLFLIELLLCQNLFGRFLSVTSGLAA